MTKDWLEDVFRYNGGSGLMGVYVSYKPRKASSKLFGFARYGSKHEAMRAIKKVNGLSVGGVKIKVSFAKFVSTMNKDTKDGEMNQRKRKHVKEEGIPGSTIMVRHKNGSLDGRSFVDVVKSGVSDELRNQDQCGGDRKAQKEPLIEKKGDEMHLKINATPIKENLDWLKRSIIGFTWDLVDMEMVHKTVENYLIWCQRIMNWGDHKFIIICKTLEGREKLKSLGLKAWGETVRDIREWRKEDTAISGEGIWYSCVGVPLHCWSPDTFLKIGETWGRVTAVELGRDFVRGWILVDSKKDNQERAMIKETTLVCEGIEYPIRRW